MNEQPAFQKWLDRVSYDLDTAKAMLQTGRLIYAVFMCQQSLEKAIKALLVFQGKEVIPIHNLRRLAEKVHPGSAEKITRFVEDAKAGRIPKL